MKKTILFGASLLMVSGGILTACSNENEFTDLELLQEQVEQKQILNKETSDFKDGFIEMIKGRKVETRSSGDEFTLSEEQIESLKVKGIDMFKSHGISEKEIEELNAGGDESFIALAIIFASVVEQPSMIPARIKTKSENEACFDANKVADCLLRAFGIKEILNGCITKTALVKILGKYVNTIGTIAMAVDFANCIGWIDYNKWFKW